MKAVKIGIIGAGGYARFHLKCIHSCEEKGLCSLKAAVIRLPYEPGDAEMEKELVKKGVTIYRDYLRLFAAERGKLDLISVPCGIDQHEKLSVAALEAGFHVLCEKPVAGTLEEGLRMRTAAERAGKILAIGFQHIFSPSIHRIKAITLEKKLGGLLLAKTCVMWPRDTLYYKRNSWAGKMQHNGQWIYDSPIQNATSHFLNNMLYIAGEAPDEAVEITAVYGENYRAKAIESADTQYLRAECRGGAVLHYFATHAAKQNVQPVTEYIFEQGKIIWQLEHNGRTAVYTKQPGGTLILTEEFDDGDVSIREEVFINTIEAIDRGKLPHCHIGNSLQHLNCVLCSFTSSKGVITIDPCYLEQLPVKSDTEQDGNDTSGETNTVIRGIEETIRAMYEKEVGFYHFGLPWARESRTVMTAGNIT